VKVDTVGLSLGVPLLLPETDMAHPPRPRQLACLAAAATLVATAVLPFAAPASALGAAAPAAADATSPWTAQSSTNLPEPSAFNDVSSASSTTAWAVGSAKGAPLVAKLTRSGNTVTTVPVALPKITWTGALYHVRAVSSTNVWASSAEGSTADHLIHWDGTSWSNVSYPGDTDAQARIQQIAASPGYGPWFLVSYADGHGELLHPNGSTWTQQAVPVPVADANGNAVAAVSQDTAGALWLAGVPSATADPAVLRVYKYVGGKAQLVTASAGPDVTPSGITSGPDGLWVSGAHSDPDFSAFMHWSGGAWHEATEDISDVTDLGQWELYGGPKLFTDAQGRPAWSGTLFAAIPNSEGPFYFDSIYEKYQGNGVWASVSGAPLSDYYYETISGVTALPGTTAYIGVGTRTDESGVTRGRIEYTNTP
jgi:hypothetical protein